MLIQAESQSSGNANAKFKDGMAALFDSQSPHTQGAAAIINDLSPLDVIKIDQIELLLRVNGYRIKPVVIKLLHSLVRLRRGNNPQGSLVARDLMIRATKEMLPCEELSPHEAARPAHVTLI